MLVTLIAAASILTPGASYTHQMPMEATAVTTLIAQTSSDARLDRCLGVVDAAARDPRFSWAPNGWVIECSVTLAKGKLGYTDYADRLIVLNARIPNGDMRATLAHELGHAEQYDWPTWKQAAWTAADAEERMDTYVSADTDYDRYQRSSQERWATARQVHTTGVAAEPDRPYFDQATITAWSTWR